MPGNNSKEIALCSLLKILKFNNNAILYSLKEDRENEVKEKKWCAIYSRIERETVWRFVVNEVER